MEGSMDSSFSLISEAFEKYRFQVLNYVNYKIENYDDSEDLVQDTYVRLLECSKLICEDTIKSFIFTIAHNLVADYLRRRCKKQEIASYIMENAVSSTRSPESDIIANDIKEHEVRRMSLLPSQRKKIYYMNRFMDMSADDISKKLCLSKRTVENHLFISRKEVREYIKQCI